MKVSLREVQRDDLPSFFEHQCDPTAVRLAAFTSKDQKTFTEHWNKILANNAVTRKTILLDGMAVGFIVCFDRDGKREIGYWIGRDYWGIGIASKAVHEFLLDVAERPLYGIVASRNIASIRVLEKCGFARVGRNRRLADPGEPAIEELTLRLG